MQVVGGDVSLTWEVRRCGLEGDRDPHFCVAVNGSKARVNSMFSVGTSTQRLGLLREPYLAGSRLAAGGKTELGSDLAAFIKLAAKFREQVAEKGS